MAALPVKPPEAKQSGGKLGGQDGGEPQVEFGLPGFVAEQPHSRQAAQAAPQGRYGEQSGLRYSPEVFFGFFLVGKHNQQPHRIDCQQIKKEKRRHAQSFQEVWI